MANTKEEASLFLMQATLGASYETIEKVATEGIESWLDKQLANTVSTNDTFLYRTNELWKDFKTQAIRQFNDNGDGNIIGKGNACLPYNFYFRMSWWHKTLSKSNSLTSKNYTIKDKNNSDISFSTALSEELDETNLLRHRIAQALSEIIVISDKSNLELDALGMADFYDILYKHAFDDYDVILKKICLHPCMGVYLTHLNNRKEDLSKNRHPDENFARELMQLFTIGLNELNLDGSLKDGKEMPTYDNNDIKQLSKVFTGIKADSYEYEWPGQISGFTNGDNITLNDSFPKSYKTIPFISMTKSMKEASLEHDTSAKTLLNGKININAGGSLVQDVNKAVDDLVKHPNTAPFICKKLIQQLTSSNPSTSYIFDVASIFKNNNGNLALVIKAILFHTEAKAGKKLKSPLLRMTQILRAFKADNTSKKRWFRGDVLDFKLNQHVLSSPTVFNFYLANYSPHGDIENAGNVAPEFELHNAATSIAYANTMYELLFAGTNSLKITVPSQIDSVNHFKTSDITLSEDALAFDFTYERTLAIPNKLDELIQRLSLILTSTQELSIKDDIKNTIINKIGFTNKDWLIQTIIFMIVVSPEFTVLKKR